MSKNEQGFDWQEMVKSCEMRTLVIAWIKEDGSFGYRAVTQDADTSPFSDLIAVQRLLATEVEVVLDSEKKARDTGRRVVTQ